MARAASKSPAVDAAALSRSSCMQSFAAVQVAIGDNASHPRSHLDPVPVWVLLNCEVGAHRELQADAVVSYSQRSMTPRARSIGW